MTRLLAAGLPAGHGKRRPDELRALDVTVFASWEMRDLFGSEIKSLLAADPVEAAKWHMLASEAGRPDAELDTYVQSLSEPQREEARARVDSFKAEASEKQAASE